MSAASYSLAFSYQCGLLAGHAMRQIKWRPEYEDEKSISASASWRSGEGCQLNAAWLTISPKLWHHLLKQPAAVAKA